MKRIAVFMQEKVYIYEIPDEELERVKRELEENNLEYEVKDVRKRVLRIEKKDHVIKFNTNTKKSYRYINSNNKTYTRRINIMYTNERITSRYARTTTNNKRTNLLDR